MMTTNATRRAAALPFLMAAACASEVDVQVNLAYPNLKTADATLTELDWSFTDSGRHISRTEHLAWAPDGDLVALTQKLAPPDDDQMHPELPPVVARFAPDGELRWAVEISAATIVPDPQYEVAAIVGAVNVFDDGGILIGATVVDRGWVGGEEGGVNVASVQGALLWYGADGALLASRAFPVTKTGQGIVWINSVLALPDGGAVFSGNQYSGQGDGYDVITGSIVGRVNVNGEFVWTVPVNNASGDPADGGGRPEHIRDLTLTADGGIVFAGSFNGKIEIQDKSVSALSGGYVARLEPDGSCAWLSGPFAWGPTPLVATSSGDLISLVRHQGRYGSPELPEHERSARIAVLDPGGALVRETDIEELPPVVSDHSSGARYALAMAGESLVIGGFMDEPADVEYESFYQTPFAAMHDQSGAVIASRRMMVLPPELDEQRQRRRDRGGARRPHCPVGSLLRIGRLRRRSGPQRTRGLAGVHRRLCGRGPRRRPRRRRRSLTGMSSRAAGGAGAVKRDRDADNRDQRRDDEKDAAIPLRPRHVGETHHEIVNVHGLLLLSFPDRTWR